jgi:hypothetical protein
MDELLVKLKTKYPNRTHYQEFILGRVVRGISH